MGALLGDVMRVAAIHRVGCEAAATRAQHSIANAMHFGRSVGGRGEQRHVVSGCKVFQQIASVQAFSKDEASVLEVACQA